MSMTFLVTVTDDGSAVISRLSEPVGGHTNQLVATLSDPSFEPGIIKDGDRIDIHVKFDNGVKRDLIFTLLDDTVPIFANAEEAEAWMAERESGQVARYG